MQGIQISGTTGANVVACRSCGEVIYPDLLVLADHDIVALPDGRTRVYSRAFERVVHLCTPEAIAESVVLEATRLLYA